MFNHLHKQEISSTAKKIKKELTSINPSQKLSHQSIVDILKNKLGIEDNEEHINKNNKPNSLDYLNAKKAIINEIKERTNITIKNVYCLDLEINNIRESFKENFYSYNLAQYIQAYELLNGDSIIDKKIETFQDAFDLSKDFVRVIFNKYYNMEDELKNKYKHKLLHSSNVFEYKELFVILKKIENKVALTNCDELCNDIIKTALKKASEDKYSTAKSVNKEYLIDSLSPMINSEIVRLKCLIEQKSNYTGFVEIISPYNFETKTETERKMIAQYSENLKDDSIYIGTEISKKLSNNIKMKDTLMIRKDSTFLNLFNKVKQKKKLRIPMKSNDALYISGTIGSGRSELLNNFLVENWLKKEVNLFFNFWGDNALMLKMQQLKNLTSREKDICIINDKEFLELSKERLISLLKKEKSIFFNFPVLEVKSIELNNKYLSKFYFVLNIIGQHKKKKQYNIFINDANIVFNKKTKYGNKLLLEFHKMRNEFNNTKFYLRGTLSIDEDFLIQFENKLIMKTECALSLHTIDAVGFNDLHSFYKNISNLQPIELIWVRNNIVNINDPIYKIDFLNIEYISNVLIFDSNE